MEYMHAVLLLHEAKKEINEENLKKVIESVGIKADEAKIKTLLASLEGVNIDKELEQAAVQPVAAAKPEKKKEEKVEKKEAAEGLASLFGA